MSSYEYDKRSEMLQHCVWGTVAIAMITFLCLAHRSCAETEVRVKAVHEQNRAAVHRARADSCRTACGALGVREVTDDKCTCD